MPATGGSDQGLSLRFWGVRGSTPCPGPSTLRYGGNTPCVEIRYGARLLILDAGTGIVPLGRTMPRGVDCDLLLTHTHLDHVAGLPFFAPAFDRRARLRIHAGHLPPGHALKAAIERLMSPPLLPISPAVLRSDISWHDFAAGETLQPAPEVLVRTGPLDHPNGATGYRIEHDGRSVAYITDTNHVPGQLDPSVLALIEGADIVIYDAAFTDDEHAARRDWGHSTWQQGVRLCDAAGAGRLVLFHHAPERDDAAMDELAAAAAAARPGTLAASEGLVLTP